MEQLVIGLDFGTDSVRALLVNTATGEEMRTAVHAYTRWAARLYCDPANSLYRQHPLDYIEGMIATVKSLFLDDRSLAPRVVAISVCTTGSTPVAIDRFVTPLALRSEFAANPNAMFMLWKDHTANDEATEINKLAHKWSMDFTKYSGGTYSSEWFWAKLLHAVRTDDAVRQHAFSWIEHCDWIPALLTGVTDVKQVKRSRCAAGHKAMWHDTFDGLPSPPFLTALDPALSGLRARLYTETFTSDMVAGTLSAKWSETLGLPMDVKVGVGALDAHFGAVGACIEPYKLVKVIGTSTCDMLTVPGDEFTKKNFNGICGQVDGSIVPNVLGIEAGQSAFGDLYAWFQQLLAYPFHLFGDVLTDEEIMKVSEKVLPALSAEASRLSLSESDIVALDWINGRRTPNAALHLTSTISRINLGSDAPHLFKALVEATAFGSRAIVDHLKSQGLAINEVIAVGGIAKKSPYVMQTLADVLHLPIRVVRSEQACALGAAMFAAVVAGVYPTVEEAQRRMTSGFETTYLPDTDKMRTFEILYSRYVALGKATENSAAVL
jgi:L-ribulokinase